MSKPQWVWEPFDPAKTSLSGDIGKLFRNDEVKTPGVLMRGAPPPNAAVMAREVIQNSWDAAGDARDLFPPPAEFQIEFAFRSASGKDKSSLIDALALRGLADRLHECDANDGRTKLGLRDQVCLDSLDDAGKPLTSLVITETGTTGMYGVWGPESRMYLALATLGYTPKPEGGGSYGYGKAGLIRGSATRSVIAYSCFREQRAEPAVTRRLLGMTYWGYHDLGAQSYPGFARFGQPDGEAIIPFENDRADEIAESLGLNRRDQSNRSDFGTTFLIVEPTVEPNDLQCAIERYWWPALEDSSISFGVSIRTAEGVEHPRPKRDPVLRSFIRAYELATIPQDNPPQHGRRNNLTKIDGHAVGALGLVAEPGGWSYPQQTEVEAAQPVEHRSLVALMRKPRMIVEYYVVGQTPPFVRGAFVADDEIDQTLRQTEPKGHDAWQTKPDDDGDPVAAERARKVLDRIKGNVRTFRESLKPPKPPQEQVHLPEFDRLMRPLLRDDTGPPPPPPPGVRDVSISLDPRPEEAANGQIRVKGRARFGLSDEFNGDHAPVDVRIRYLLMEDNRIGDAVPLTIRPPLGFVLPEGSDRYRGTIHRGSPVQFTFESETHDDLWTGRMIAEAEIVEVKS